MMQLTPVVNGEHRVQPRGLEVAAIFLLDLAGPTQILQPQPEKKASRIFSVLIHKLGDKAIRKPMRDFLRFLCTENRIGQHDTRE
jgi:hypothetical protein